MSAELDADAKWRQNRYEYAMECPRRGCDYITPVGTVDQAEEALRRHRDVHEEPRDDWGRPLGMYDYRELSPEDKARHDAYYGARRKSAQ